MGLVLIKICHLKPVNSQVLLFFRVARSTRMTQIWALRSRLEKQPTDLRRSSRDLGDGTLAELCYHCFRHDSVGLTSNTGGGVLPGSAPLDYLPGDQARDSEREFAYPPD